MIKQKRILENLFAFFLFIAGTFFIIFSGPSITSAAIGVSNTGLSLVTFAGLMFMLAAATILAEGTLENRVEKQSGQVYEDIGLIYKKIEEQEKKHKSQKAFIKGLEKIKKFIKEDANSYETTKDASIKGTIGMRIHDWVDAIDRRETYFFKIPTHAGRSGIDISEGLNEKAMEEARMRGYFVTDKKDNRIENIAQEKIRERLNNREVFDVPDWGLYPYEPVIKEGGKSKYATLDLIHYTDNASRKKIENKFRKVKNP